MDARTITIKTTPQSKSHKVLYIIIALSLISVVIFIVVLIIFLSVEDYDSPHPVVLINETSNPVTAYIGSGNNNNPLFTVTLQDFQSKAEFQVDPGVECWVKFIENTSDSQDDPSTTNLQYLTTGIIQITESKLFPTSDIVYNGTKYPGVKFISPDNNSKMGVSIAGGYNGILIINAIDDSGSYLGTVPGWNDQVKFTSKVCTGIGVNIGINLCYPDNKNCQMCLSPCSGCIVGGGCKIAGNGGVDYCCTGKGICEGEGNKCGESWGKVGSVDLYSLYQGMCKDCMISNCDGVNQNVGNGNGKKLGFVVYFAGGMNG